MRKQILIQKTVPLAGFFFSLFLLGQTILPTQSTFLESANFIREDPNYISALSPILNRSLELSEYPSAFTLKSAQEKADTAVSVASDPLQTNPIYTRGLLKNAPRPVATPTYDGSGQAVHPSVIDFRTEYQLKSWRGYRYWMVMTPYPNGHYHLENPSLLASQDGLNWVAPPGLKKPLDIRKEKFNFNSDPCLVYDPDAKALLVYWRESLRGDFDRFWRIKLGEKGKPELKELILEQKWGKPAQLILSPSIWRKSPTEWHLWVSNGEGTVYLYDSRDGVTWSNRRAIQSPWKNWNGGLIPWHLEVKPYPKENKLALLLSGWPKTGKMADQVLVYGETPMNDLTTVTMPLNQPLLAAGAANHWDDDFVYKSSFVLEEKSGRPYIRVWYSARSMNNFWHMGYTEGHLK